MTVGDVQVQVRRTAPFTATEHARGAALADLVTDVLDRGRDGALAPSRAAASAAARPRSTSSRATRSPRSSTARRSASRWSAAEPRASPASGR